MLNTDSQKAFWIKINGTRDQLRDNFLWCTLISVCLFWLPLHGRIREHGGDTPEKNSDM